MNDTLTYVLDKILSNQEQGIDLVQKVDSFYNNAWTKLIFIISIGFTIVGVIVPLFIQWLQKRTLKASEDLLKKEIADKTKAIKDEISTNLKKEIEEKFKLYEKEIEITRASANAKLYLAEGKVKLSMNYYDKALSDFITASENCMKSDNYPSLNDALKLISEDCLPYLSMEEINDLKTRNNCDLNYFLDNLTKTDDRFYFREIIGEIRVIISKLPRTIKDKPEEKSKQPQE
jgi:tetratricopeptide (TPR) repeat protein